MTTPKLISKIATSYGLEPQTIASRQSGYRNHSYRISPRSGPSVNLIIFKREPDILSRIRRANYVSDSLANLGLPTRRTLGPITQLSRDHYLRYAALYSYLPGTTIPWEAYTMEHIKLLGATMGQLHTSLRSLTAPPEMPLVTTEYLAIVDRMERYFSDPQVAAPISQKLGLSLNYQLCSRYRNLLRACAKLPHQQILHMDLVRGNVLFAESNIPRITGILDFEKTALGHPVFDIARTLAFLLVDSKFKTEAQVHKYFLLSGYHRRGQQPLPRARLLKELVNLFLLYDFYKFLRHNPYEFLHQNEHYLRTRDLLLQRGIVTRTQIP